MTSTTSFKYHLAKLLAWSVGRKDIKQGEEILSNYKRFEKTKNLI